MLKEREKKKQDLILLLSSGSSRLVDYPANCSHRDAVVRDGNMVEVGGRGGRIQGGISIASKRSSKKWWEGAGLFFFGNTVKLAEKMLTAKFHVVV